MRRKYKVDLWSYGFKYFSAYYRYPFWPFWFRCVRGLNGMCPTIEEAEKQAIDHSKGASPTRKDLGWLP